MSNMDRTNLSTVTLSITGGYNEMQIVDFTNAPSPGPTYFPTELTMRPTPRPVLARTPRPVVPQTPRPTAPQDVEKTVPLQFNLDGITLGYEFGEDDPAAILEIIKATIAKNLGPTLDLGNVEYSGHEDDEFQSGRRLQQDTDAAETEGSLYLPLDVTVSGPAGKIDDAYPNLLELAELYKDEIAAALKEYNPEAFKDVEVSVEPSDVIDYNTGTIITSHTTQLVLNNVDNDYEMPKEDREYFIQYIKEKMKEEITGDWELIQVAYSSRTEMEAPMVPVFITVRGPMEDEDEALGVVLEALRARLQNFARFLKTDVDRNVFRNVIVTLEVMELEEIVEPTFVTEHPVLVKVMNISAGYTFNSKHRKAFIIFMKELIENNLNDRLRLIDLVYAGQLASNTGKNFASIPLRVTVVGPEQISKQTYEFVMEIIDDYEDDIRDFLKNLDDKAFKDTSLEIEQFDFDSIMPARLEETVHNVKLIFMDAPISSNADRRAIIKFIKDLYDEFLEDSFTWLKLISGGNEDDSSLPLQITVEGPSDESDSALSYVMDVLEKYKRDVEKFIKSLDEDKYEEVEVTVQIHDPDAEDEMEETVHPIKLILEGASPGSSLSDDNRDLIVDFVEDLIDENLNDPFSLIGIDSLDISTGDLSLPLLIMAEEPTGESALSEILDILEDNKKDLEGIVKGLDWNTFKEVGISLEIFDLESVETVHPIKLNIEGAPPGSSLSDDNYQSIVGFVEDLIGENLENSFSLVGIDPSDNTGDLSLPLLITLEGPAAESESVLSELMDLLEDNKRDFEGMVKGLDWNAFKDSEVSFETFDPDAVETVHPVKLNIEGAPPGSSLSDDNYQSIVGFVEDIIDENLENSFGLVGIDPSDNTGDLSLSLLITLEGPAAESESALSELMDVLEDNKKDLEGMVKGLDWNTFKDSEVSFETYDPDAQDEIETVETVHPVELNFENMPGSYQPSQDDRASIAGYVKEFLDKNLDESLETVSVDDATASRIRSLSVSAHRHPRRLDTASVPLSVTVKGPADESDLARPHVLDALENSKDDLAMKLKSEDWETFKDAELSFKMYDPNSESEETVHPVRLVFENIRSSYSPPRDDREMIIRFVKERTDQSLDNAFDLTEMSYAASWNRRSLLSPRLRSGVGNLTLPLLIKARSSPAVSDFALSYILEAMRDNARDIELYVKSLDDDVFMNTVVSVEPYWLIPVDPIIMDEDAADTPWWIWLLVVFTIILLLCCCCVCCLNHMYRYKKTKEIYRKSDGEVIMKDTNSSYSDSISTDFTRGVPPLMITQIQNKSLPYVPFTEVSINSIEDNVVCVPREVPDYSVITYQDAPPDYSVAIQTGRFPQDPPSDMTLVHRDSLLALPPHSEEVMPICADPKLAYYDDEELTYATTSVAPNQEYLAHPDTLLVQEAYDAQPHRLLRDPSVTQSHHLLDDPSGMYHWEEDQSISSQQHTAVRSAASVNPDSNALVLLHGSSEHQPYVPTLEDPGGVYNFDDQQSYAASESKDRGGVYNFNDQQSYAASESKDRGGVYHFNDQQSYAASESTYVTQDPSTMHGWNDQMSIQTGPDYTDFQVHAVQEARNVVAAHEKGSSFTTQGPSSTIDSEYSIMSNAPKKRYRRKTKMKRRTTMPNRAHSEGASNTGGVSDSKDGRDDFYYGNPKTFHGVI